MQSFYYRNETLRILAKIKRHYGSREFKRSTGCSFQKYKANIQTRINLKMLILFLDNKGFRHLSRLITLRNRLKHLAIKIKVY